MKNLKIGLISLVSILVGNASFLKFSFAGEDHIEGQLHGIVKAPEGADLSAIMIQVIGANQKDKFIYYTLPDANGEFNFDHLPAGSVVQLYVWDGNGVLNSTTLSAYVNKTHSKEFGAYEIVLQEIQYSQNIANIYRTNHDFTSAGLCGMIERYHPEGEHNVKISVYDRLAKYTGPLFEQNLDANDRFCFFNLNSISGTDMYDIVVSGPSEENKTFTFYLPAATFMHDVFLDAGASVYRPIAPFLWKENFFSQKTKQWEKLNSVNLATSDDYSFVSYDKNLENENLFYFPLTNELLEISYFVAGEDPNHFFLLLPRASLFFDTKGKVLAPPVSKSVYVDHDHPFPMKFVTQEELVKLNSNYYFQTISKTFGSAFVNADLTKFNIENTNQVKLSLRNLKGQEVSVFEELITLQNNHLLGFFLNLIPGRYQLFLTDLQGELLWTYEVRSYPNRVQVLTNDLDMVMPANEIRTSVKPQKTVENNLAAPIVSETQKSSLPLYKPTIEMLNEKNEFHSLREEKVFLQNNILYKNDSDVFCKIKRSHDIPRTLIDQIHKT